MKKFLRIPAESNINYSANKGRMYSYKEMFILNVTIPNKEQISIIGKGT